MNLSEEYSPLGGGVEFETNNVLNLQTRMIPPTQNESSTSASTFGLKKDQKVSNKTQKTQIKSPKELKTTYKQG